MRSKRRSVAYSLHASKNPDSHESTWFQESRCQDVHDINNQPIVKNLRRVRNLESRYLEAYLDFVQFACLVLTV